MATEVGVDYVITKMVVGGAQETVLQSARALAPEFDLSVAYGPDGLDGPNLLAELEATGAKTRLVGALRRSVLPWLDLVALFQLVRHLRRRRGIIVHTHSSKAGVLGRTAGRILRRRVVHTVHGWSFHERLHPRLAWLIIRLERVLAHMTDAIVVVCERDREIGLQNRIGKRAQYRVIPSAIDVAAFAKPGQTKAAQREILGVPVDGLLVGFIGRLSKQKDPEGFVRCAEEVAKHRNDVSFILVGDGPLESEVRRLVAKMDLRDRFFVLPSRRDIADTLGALDIFVLPSLWEGLPRIVLEAQAAGVAVVATDVGGVSEAVTDNVNGLLVAPAQPLELAAAVSKLCAGAELRSRLCDAARESVTSYDLQVMSAGLRDLYNELSSGSK